MCSGTETLTFGPAALGVPIPEPVLRENTFIGFDDYTKLASPVICTIQFVTDGNLGIAPNLSKISIDFSGTNLVVTGTGADSAFVENGGSLGGAGVTTANWSGSVLDIELATAVNAGTTVDFSFAGPTSLAQGGTARWNTVVIDTTTEGLVNDSKMTLFYYCREATFGATTFTMSGLTTGMISILKIDTTTSAAVTDFRVDFPMNTGWGAA